MCSPIGGPLRGHDGTHEPEIPESRVGSGNGTGRGLSGPTGDVDTARVDVLTALRNSPHPLSDDELAEILGRDRQVISRECRSLAFRGLVIREQQAAGVVNKVTTGDS